MMSPMQRIANWIHSFNPYVPEKLGQDELKPIQVEESEIKRKASKLILVSFAGFFAWAALAPIDSGVPVNGTVVVLGNRKAVQHPNGGVVEEILVREGSQVKQGDVVIRINPLSIEANLNQAEAEYIHALAAHSRLVAERDGAKSIQWSKELDGFGASEEVAEARTLQTHLFNSRRNEYLGQRSMLIEQQAGLESQLKELLSILDARKDQTKILDGELQNHEELARDGFVPRSRYHEMLRAKSDLQASTASSLSEFARVQASVSSTRLEIAKLEAAFMKDVDAQLTENQKSRQALKARVDSLRFDQSLTTIRAPVSGSIVGLKVHTIGGVIKGGDVLMEVVPHDQSLVVEAAVPPNMIDKVHVGLEADMRFSAFNVTTTPVVPGRVRVVGADRLPPAPPQHPEEYYLVQVETTEGGKHLLGDKVIQAGMPVEVIIKTGERTFLSYMVKPISDRFARSFKEN